MSILWYDLGPYAIGETMSEPMSANSSWTALLVLWRRPTTVLTQTIQNPTTNVPKVMRNPVGSNSEDTKRNKM